MSIHKGKIVVEDARIFVEGDAQGPPMIIDTPISFLGDVDPTTGYVKNRWSIPGHILIIPKGVGSSVGSYVLYSLKVHKLAPNAIMVREADQTMVSGCALASIPLIMLGGHYRRIVEFAHSCSYLKISARRPRGAEIACLRTR